jgi:hypothetical protein
MSTNLNGFSVNIIGDNVVHFQKGEHNYYAVPHLSEYKIKLSNNRPMRCDAEVSIDVDPGGTWRIESFDSIVIERPANLNRKFIFVEEKSNVAQEVGIQSSRDNGLIAVVFSPEKVSPPTMYFNAAAQPSNGELGRPGFGLGSGSGLGSKYWGNEGSYLNANSGYQSNTYQHSNGLMSSTSGIPYNSGATILGGGTDQYFNTATPIGSIDSNNITTINLRLVAPNRPNYISIKDAMRKSVAVPPRIDDDDLVLQFNDRMFNSDRGYW